MLVSSIDPLAAYKVSDDLILELMSVTASVEDDSEGASVGTWWVQIVEPHELAKHQPHGGYAQQPPSPNDLCQKRGNQPWRPNKIQDSSITGMDSLSEAEIVAPTAEDGLGFPELPINATNHRGGSGSAFCHGYEQSNSIVTFNPVVMRSSFAKLAENSPCSNR